MLLNLDPDFVPFTEIPEIPFKSWTFSGGEIGFKLLEQISFDHKVLITARLTNSDKIMELLMATDALKRAGITNIQLCMPYVPYARQDRLMVKGESLSLKVFADLINAQNYNWVRCFDIHNESTLGLFNNITNVDNHKFVQKAINESRKGLKNTSNYWLVSPDGGALKKIYGLAKHLQHKWIVKCDKERCPLSGEILSTSVNNDNLKGWDCWIVDDCVDGGMTFIKLAEELKRRNCGHIYLVVSHGIFSKGFDLPGIDLTYTTNSFRDIEHPKVIQMKLNIDLLI